jgi:hypothetical protein
MRRGLRLLGMLLCCATLFGAYMLLGSNQAAESTLPAEEESAASYFLLYQDALSSLKSITVLPKGYESYTVVSDMAFDTNGNLLGVYNALSQPFLVEGNELFTLNSDAWQMLIIAAQYIPATASYPALDRDACGLTDPDAVITILHTDGTSRTLRIGHKTSDGASCYFALDGDDNVYLVPYDLHDTLCKPLQAHHTLPAAITESTSDALQIAVVDASNSRLIFSKGTTDNSLLKWHSSTPLVHDGDTTQINAFIEGVCAVYAEAYITTVSDMEGLALYGLDDPRRLIVSFSDGTIRDIHIGSDAGEGTVYVRMDSTGDIYTISRTQLAFADGSGVDTLLNRYVALVPAYNVSQTLIRTTDTLYLLSTEYSGDDDTLGQRWLFNGKDISQEAFSSCYAAVIGLMFDKSAEQDVSSGALLAEITFTLRSGSTQTVRYTTYDDYYALAETSGGGSFLVRLSSVKAMLSTLSSQ